MNLKRVQGGPAAAIALSVLVWAAHPLSGWQSQSNGRIVGKIDGPDGTGLAGTQVWARAVSVRLRALRAPVITRGDGVSAMTDGQGRFVLENVEPGDLYVCAGRADLDLLDPCLWSQDVPLATVAAGATSDVGRVRLVKGVRHTVNLTYLPELLNDAAFSDFLNRVSVMLVPENRRGLVQAGVAAQTSSQKTHTILIPYAQRFKLLVAEPHLAFKTSDGKPLDLAGAGITVFVPTTSGPQTTNILLPGLK